MPKMKSNRGASKSFKKTASGRFKGKMLIKAISLLPNQQNGKETCAILLWFPLQIQIVLK